MSIKEWIVQHITEPLQEMIIDSVNAVLISFLEDLTNVVTGTMGEEIKLAGTLLNHPYFMTAVKYAQGIAISLLIVRILYQAFHDYILYNSGEEAHPGELLRSSLISVAVITSVPWIVKQVYMFSISIVDDIQKFQAVVPVSNLQEAITVIIFTATGGVSVVMVLAMIIAMVLWLMILIQMAVRTVNIGILMLIGPFLWAFKEELGNVWFRNLLAQCLAMPVQIFLLRGAIGNIVTVHKPFMAAALFIGFLWAAIKFPAFLQQLVAQTGVGSAVGGTVQHVGSTVLMRRVLMR